MTKVEAQAKSNDKMKAVQTFCAQMQIVLSAEQIITKDGFIKNIVYYNDTEKYDIDEEINPKKDEKYQPTDEEIAALQSKDTPA